MKWLLIFCLSAVSAQAALKWDQTKVTLQVHPTQVSEKAVFRFSNAGKKAVTITDMKVGCGCLAPKLTKKTYAPGERGELIIRFDLRNRTGKQNKPTTISMDDGKKVVLYTAVDIPKAYHINPIMMRWLQGNTNETKTARLVNPNTQPILIQSIASSHQDLAAELKIIRDGFEYEVIITKKPAAANARSVVRIDLEPPPGLKEAKTLKFYVHAQ